MKSRILSLAAAVVVAAPLAAHAKSVTYDFAVQGNFIGPLGDAQSSGTFSYDTSIIPVGGGLVTGQGLLTGLSFTWDGISYDQTTANTGGLIFSPSGQLDAVNFGNDCNLFGYGGCSQFPDSVDWVVSGSSYGPVKFATLFYTIGDGNYYEGYVQLTPQAVAAPEIDPATAASAVTMLLGGLAVLRCRRRKA